MKINSYSESSTQLIEFSIVTVLITVTAAKRRYPAVGIIMYWLRNSTQGPVIIEIYEEVMLSSAQALEMSVCLAFP